MYNFMINIIDENNRIAVISGVNDDPDQWYPEDDTFVNINIPSIKLMISDDNDKIKHHYIIKNIQNLQMLIVDSNGAEISDIDTLSNCIHKMSEADDIEKYNSNEVHNAYIMRIDDTEVMFSMHNVIGYKTLKSIVNIDM